MDDEDKSTRARKQRMRAKREAEGLAQVSGWVPAARRAYAREILRAVGDGANSLPPDPELLAALDSMRDDLAKARNEIETREQILQAARGREVQLQAEMDAAKASEAERIAEAKQIVQDARERAKAALERAKNAERTVKRVKGIPGFKGRLVQWLVGDVLSD